MVLVENCLAQAEQSLNLIDWIPYASSFSGMVRILASAVEVAAGVALAALRSIQILLTNSGTYSGAMEEGLLYSLHGLGNIARGALAMIPFWNLLLIVHDTFLGRMNYPDEKMEPGVYPLMTAYRLVSPIGV